VIVVLYVFLLVLDSPWTNHGVSWLQQDCSFSIFTETMLVNNPQEGRTNESMKEIEETLKLSHLHVSYFWDYKYKYVLLSHLHVSYFCDYIYKYVLYICIVLLICELVSCCSCLHKSWFVLLTFFPQLLVQITHVQRFCCNYKRILTHFLNLCFQSQS